MKPSFETIIAIGLESGLTFDAIMMMTVGQVVDIAIERANRDYRAMKKSQDKKTRSKRKASQVEWDAFLG